MDAAEKPLLRDAASAGWQVGDSHKMIRNQINRMRFGVGSVGGERITNTGSKYLGEDIVTIRDSINSIDVASQAAPMSLAA